MEYENYGIVSIIVPVYNVERYLRECVESLISQTYRNIEILLVDDGSTDESGKIIDEYAARDNRVKAFHKQNGGQASARNIGLDNSSGDYYMFVDSDDSVGEDYVEKLLGTLYEKDADTVFCNFFSHFVNEDVPSSRLAQYTEVRKFSGEEYLHCFYQYTGAYTYLWNKIYKKKVFESLRYKEGIKCEDAEIMLRIIDKCDSIYYIPETLYYYRRRQSSTIMAVQKEDMLKADMFWLEEHMDSLKASGRVHLHDMALKAYLHKIAIGLIYCKSSARKEIKKKMWVGLKTLLHSHEFGLPLKAKYLISVCFPNAYGKWYEKKYKDNGQFWE